MLATGLQGNQASQPFTVTYADSTTTTFSQSLSDWFTPQNYPGESKAMATGHRNNSDGTMDSRTFYLYGYSFNLSGGKIVQSLKLPNNGHVAVLAISLIPDWPPTFTVNPFTLPAINAGLAYSGTIATNATDLNNDPLTFAKLSGPAWLSVAANGTLSGTPSSSDAGTSVFVVSATDPAGFSASATMNITVVSAPSITSSLVLQGFGLLLNWSGGVPPYQVQMATNLASPDWQPVGSLTSATSMLLSPTNAAAFYRVLGQ